MSDRAQAWVWDHSGSKGTDKLILLKFADEADHWGEHSIVGLDTMCDTTGVVRSTVREAIKRLTKLGELEIQESAGGRGKPTTYRLPKVPKKKGAAPNGPPDPKGTDSDTFGGGGKGTDSDTFPEAKGAERCGKGTDSDTFRETASSYKELEPIEPTNTAREGNPSQTFGSQDPEPDPTPAVNRKSPGPKASAGARPIPADWEPPPEELLKMAVDFPLVDIPFETAQIIDWALSKGVKRVDWVATWRKCLRAAQKRAAAEASAAGSSAPGPRKPRSSADVASDEEYAAAFAAAEASENGWGV